MRVCMRRAWMNVCMIRVPPQAWMCKRETYKIVIFNFVVSTDKKVNKMQ